LLELLNYNSFDLVGKTALITGASSGIGQATAYLLASKGVHLKLVARREEKLQEIQKTCQENFKKITVEYVAGDINNQSTFDQMESKGFFKSNICINNAGLAIGKEPVASGNILEWELMLQTNISSAFKVIRYALPYMKENGGDIISLGSIAGHTAYANGAVYCATKAAVKAFNTSLRQETYGEDIRVMLLSPGMVNTDFSTTRFRGDAQAAGDVYKNIKPLLAMDMAHHIHYMLACPRHVNIEDMITMPTDQGSATLVRGK